MKKILTKNGMAPDAAKQVDEVLELDTEQVFEMLNNLDDDQVLDLVKSLNEAETIFEQELAQDLNVQYIFPASDTLH